MSSQFAERETVRTEAALAALCDDLYQTKEFALDTEFLGERTYVPKLCLIQIATRDFIVLIDTIEVKNLNPLWKLITDPQIVKVLHAAREDLRIAYYGADSQAPQAIFDTQIAAGFIGLPLYPLSYAKLVEALEGVKLSKGETRSEWDRRPLTPDQVRYARDDVRYLLPIYDKLKGVLQRLGRAGWMSEEMERYVEPRTYVPDPDTVYLRLRWPRSGMTARPTALLRAVAAWREREAAAQDIPVRSLLRDDALMELALRPPRRLTDFARLRSFPEGQEVSLGPGLLMALDTARALPEEQWPVALSGMNEEGTPVERVIADMLYAVGESLCLSKKIASELVFTRPDALALARQRHDTPLMTGWRRSALGASLADVASGKLSAHLTISADGPQVTLT